MRQIFVRCFFKSKIRNPKVYHLLLKYAPRHCSKILDIQESKDFICIFEEWVSGKTLYETLVEWSWKKGEWRIRNELVQKWRDQISLAVKGLHGLPDGGIIHGDISPKNIMVTREMEAVLIDFNGADVYGGPIPEKWFATKAFSEKNAYLKGLLTWESDYESIAKTFAFAQYILALSRNNEKKEKEPVVL